MRASKNWMVVGVAVLALCVGVSVGQGQDDKQPEPTMPTADWHEDELCRIIFFTVLEGLYTDGVPNEVVDLILGERVEGKEKIKHNFVFRCKLCHAVYEAFRAYRARPETFVGSKANTFGKGKAIDKELLKRLESDQPSTRVFAMGEFVQPWIKAKLLTMDMSEEESQKILKGLVELAKEGADKTMELRRTDPAYGNWDFYGSCQACKAIETVSRMGQRQEKKDK